MTTTTASQSAGTSLAGRIAAGTPAHRDRTIDALRAAAILGVVIGHWMVSATVSDANQVSALRGASPLSTMPWFIPVSWILQMLGPFFFAGGYAAARGSAGRRVGPWLTARLVRFARPVIVLALVWLPAVALLRAVAAPSSTRHVVWSLLTHPLWFLLVYLLLTALTPVLRPWAIRAGIWAVVPAVVLVALTDLNRPHLPGWWAALAVPVAWSVPYLLGLAMAEGRLPRHAGSGLLTVGLLGGAATVLLGGYPASAVGVPGDSWSNLDPPSLFALALTFTQLGIFLLVRPALSRALTRPRLWAPVALLNLGAMTTYCWHQTAMLLVTFGGLGFGPLPGLHDAPSGAWPLHRLLWLPVFALVLVCLTMAFQRFETPARRPSNAS